MGYLFAGQYSGGIWCYQGILSEQARNPADFQKINFSQIIHTHTVTSIHIHTYTDTDVHKMSTKSSKQQTKQKKLKK